MSEGVNDSLISIIILSYKNLEYINQTIESVLSQDYENIELIIGDDGTENFDIKFYKDYIENKKSNNIKNVVIYSNEKNLGITKNANKAISLSTGKYIKLIGSDDCFYERESMSKMIKYMELNDSMIVTSNVLWCDVNMDELPHSKEEIKKNRARMINCGQPRKFFKQLANGCSITAPGVIFSKKLIHEFKLFDENYVLLEDWPTWLNLARNGIKFDYLDIISVKYRVGNGLSTSKEVNPILMKDNIRCIEKEILPYKKELGYWLYKNINYNFVRQYKFIEYSLIKKITFLLVNINIVVINKIKSKANRSNTNEN